MNHKRGRAKYQLKSSELRRVQAAERPASHPMFGNDDECDDYEFDTRLAAALDNHEFAGWWDYQIGGQLGGCHHRARGL